MKNLWRTFLGFSMPAKVLTGVIVVAIAAGVIVLPDVMRGQTEAAGANMEETAGTEAEMEAAKTTEVETTEEETEAADVETGVVYANKELGFQVNLPELLYHKMSITTEEREAYGETIWTITVSYEGTEERANILSFEEMSKEVWEKMQEEGGPLGRELGTSKEGRVVVLNTIQSNPYEEGSEDFEVLQELPKELGIVAETFMFVEN